MTRSAAILAALQREITDRRASLDAMSDLATVTVTVKLSPGTMFVRGTQYSEERIVRARDQRQV
jgi:hypothetical protein